METICQPTADIWENEVQEDVGGRGRRGGRGRSDGWKKILQHFSSPLHFQIQPQTLLTTTAPTPPTKQKNRPHPYKIHLPTHHPIHSPPSLTSTTKTATVLRHPYNTSIINKCVLPSKSPPPQKKNVPLKRIKEIKETNLYCWIQQTISCPIPTRPMTSTRPTVFMRRYLIR